MLRLPVCPYCGAAYYYKDVKNAAKQKTACCHHCKQRFAVRVRAPRAVLLLCAALLMVLLDFLILSILPNIHLVGLYLTTLCLLACSLFLVPYVVRFIPIDKKDRK